MKVLRICKQDPVVDSIRSLYSANPVRVPEERIKPLCMVGSKNDAAYFLGDLADALADSSGFSFEASSGTLANLNNKRTSDVGVDAGIEILNGYLKGFGVDDNGLASLKAELTVGKSMNFAFSSAERLYVAPLKMGNLIKNRLLDVSNPSLAAYLDSNEPVSLYLIDSVIVSNGFNIQVGRTSDASIKLNVKAVQEAIAKGSSGLEAKSITGLDISFQGKTKLTFAFSCTKLTVDPLGKILYIQGTNDDVSLNSSEDVRLPQDIERVHLADASALLEFGN